MTQVIDFLFTCLQSVWNCIVANWLLSMSFLVILLGWVISLIQNSKKE